MPTTDTNASAFKVRISFILACKDGGGMGTETNSTTNQPTTQDGPACKTPPTPPPPPPPYFGHIYLLFAAGAKLATEATPNFSNCLTPNGSERFEINQSNKTRKRGHVFFFSPHSAGCTALPAC